MQRKWQGFIHKHTAGKCTQIHQYTDPYKHKDSKCVLMLIIWPLIQGELQKKKEKNKARVKEEKKRKVI